MLNFIRLNLSLLNQLLCFNSECVMHVKSRVAIVTTMLAQTIEEQTVNTLAALRGSKANSRAASFDYFRNRLIDANNRLLSINRINE